MDWVTDKFYSHFPSYSSEKQKRETLAKEKKLEYQAYLSRVSLNTPNGKSKRLIDYEKSTDRIKIPALSDGEKINKHLESDVKCNEIVQNGTLADEWADKKRDDSKHKYLDKLEKMNLPEIFDADLIKARNHKMAEEKRLKNKRYQEELKAQIEYKKREKELQKSKEREEEERQTRRMEEQLKSVRLQYEMEQVRPTRQREHTRISIDSYKTAPNYHQSPKPPITVRSETIQPSTYKFQSFDERKAQSENGKENISLVKRNDKDIYKYFTNSVRDPSVFNDLRYNNYCGFSGELSDLDIMSNSMSSASAYSHSKSIHNDRKDIANRPMCNFCKQQRFLTCSQQDNLEKSLYFCDSCESRPICLNCRKEICVRCKKPNNNDRRAAQAMKQLKNSPNNDNDHLRQCQPRKDIMMVENNKKYVETEKFGLIETDEDSLSGTSPDEHKPYTFNISESSVFHPSRTQIDRRLSVNVANGEISVEPDSFDELKRITDEKFLKLVRNYGDIRNKPENVEKESNGSRNTNPLPMINENTRKLMDFARQLERDENYLGTSSSQPILSKSLVNGSHKSNENTQANGQSAFTFTQTGAFKNQLKIGKFSFEYDDDDSNKY